MTPKSILLSLIGKEPVGNFRAYKEFAPDMLIHVYSDLTESTSEKIFSLVNKQTEIVKLKIEGDNYLNVLNKLNELNLDLSYEDNLTINVTGGTKLMCLAAIDFGKSREAFCHVNYFYTDIKSQKIHWFYKNESESFCEDLELDEYFSLRGQKIKTKDRYLELFNRFEDALIDLKELEVNNTTKTIWDKFLKNVVANVRKVNKIKGHITIFEIVKNWHWENPSSGFYINWDESCFNLFHNDILILEVQQSKRLVEWFVFNAGWFELLTAEKLSKKYKPESIFMNVTFPVLKDSNLDKNEVDILINQDGKLLFVECKSGQVNSDAINSINVREKTFGGEIGSSILVTRYPLNPKENKNDRLVVDKCNDLEIKIKTYSKL